MELSGKKAVKHIFSIFQAMASGIARSTESSFHYTAFSTTGEAGEITLQLQ